MDGKNFAAKILPFLGAVLASGVGTLIALKVYEKYNSTKVAAPATTSTATT